MKENWFEQKMNESIQNMDHELDLDLAWDRLDSARTKKKRRPLIWWFFGAIGIAALLSMIYVFGFDHEDANGLSSEVEEQKYEQNIEKGTSSIQEESKLEIEPIKTQEVKSADASVIKIKEVITDNKKYVKAIKTPVKESRSSLNQIEQKTAEAPSMTNSESTTVNNVDEAVYSRNQLGQSKQDVEKKVIDLVGVIAVNKEADKAIVTKEEVIIDDVKVTVEENDKELETKKPSGNENLETSIKSEKENRSIDVKEEESQVSGNESPIGDLDEKDSAKADAESKKTDEDEVEKKDTEADDAIKVKKVKYWSIAAYYQLGKGERSNASMLLSADRQEAEEFLETHHASLQLRRNINRLYVQGGFQYGQYISRMTKRYNAVEGVTVDDQLIEIDRTGSEPELIYGELNGTEYSLIDGTRYLRYKTLGLSLGAGYRIPISQKMNLSFGTDFLFDVWQDNQGEIYTSLEQSTVVSQLSDLDYNRSLIIENVSRIELQRGFGNRLNVGLNVFGKFDLTNRLSDLSFETPIGPITAIDKFYGFGVGLNLEYRIGKM